MCGIFGYIGNNPKSFDRELLTLKHRGPDNNSSFSHQSYNKHIYLGHTRLSIVDLSAKANQPMSSSDQEIILIFNGEIYNHNELRLNCLKDEKFISNSDTETILKLYQKLGLDFINELNGDFALSIYDKRLEKIFLFRDRLG
ncbi:MAG: hypothetical protein IPH11_00820 [Ignavibacteriales bacterium]|nr:hypothetical protein [Ignavibacteriales bacterium]